MEKIVFCKELDRYPVGTNGGDVKPYVENNSGKLAIEPSEAMSAAYNYTTIIINGTLTSTYTVYVHNMVIKQIIIKK